MRRLGQCVLLVLTVLCVVAWHVVAAVSSDEQEALRELLRSGDQSMGKGHYQEALAKYTEALVRDPQNERALFSRAELQSVQRHLADALADLDRLLALEPAHTDGLKLRMTLRAQNGELSAAVADGDHLVALYRKNKKPPAQVQSLQATVHKLRGYATRWKKIETVVMSPLDSFPSVSPSDASSYNQYRECESLLSGLISDFARDNVELRLRRAACALAVHDNQIAAPEVKYVLQRDPNHLPAIALNARVLRCLGALDQARSELRRCLSLDPEYAPCAAQHKLIRAQQRIVTSVETAIKDQAFDKALETIDEAFALEAHPPYEDQLLQWRCQIAVSNRDTVRGLRDCKRIVARLGEGNPASFDSMLQIIELHLLDDDVPSAEAVLQKAKQLNPHSPQIEQLHVKIEKLKRAGARKDYYKILGVKKTASAKEIRHAYRTLAKTHHPDQLRSKDLTESEREKEDKLFRDINEAKEVLLDDDLRKRYDNGEDVMNPNAQQQQQGNPFPGHPFFGHPFFAQGGGGGFSFHAGGPPRGHRR